MHPESKTKTIKKIPIHHLHLSWGTIHLPYCSHIAVLVGVNWSNCNAFNWMEPAIAATN